MTDFDYLQLLKDGDKIKIKETLNSDYFKKTDNCGLNPIHWASLNNQLDILKLFLKNQCDIEAVTENGWKAIHFAALRNHREIIKLLVENYCDLECKTKNNETPLDILNGNCDSTFVDKICPETFHKKIGLSMGLSCSLICNHKFCLTSLCTVRFEKGLLINNGAYTKIYKIQDSIFSKQFILKIDKQNVNEEVENEHEKSQYIEYTFDECRQLLNHERIVKYYGSLFRKDKRLIILDYMPRGSLESEITRDNPLPLTIIAQRCKDIIEGINFLHENRIIHRNIKPSKILLDKNNRCRLVMSSFSRFLNCENLDDRELCGTPCYMAPEIINERLYTFHADIWSLGASVIHMVTGKRPYPQISMNAVILTIGKTKKIEYTIPQGHHTGLEELITNMLNPIPDKRPIAKKLLDYKFIEDISKRSQDTETKLVENSYEDYIKENLKDCIDIISSAIKIRKRAAEIGFTCNPSCDHIFCLSSLTTGNFQKGEFIDRDCNGNSYKVNESQSNRKIVVKPFKITANQQLITAANIFQDEINKYCKTLMHKRLIQYYGSLRISNKLYVFTEFVEGGTIKNKILQNRTSPTPILEHLVKHYTKQVLEGLSFLHHSKIIHKNVQVGNIYLDDAENVKLGDYGFGEFLKVFAMDNKHSSYEFASFLPPESIKGENYDSSVDIWSLGVAVHEMLTGRPPLINFQNTCMVCTTINQNKPFTISNEWKSFISQMMNEDPTKRASADSLMLSNFISS